MQQGGHVIGLVLYPLAVVRNAGGANEIAHALHRTQIFVEFVVLALSAAVFVAGGIAVTMNAHGQISAAMKLPMECYYACIPIGGALMILYSLNNLYHLFRDKNKEVA